MLKYPPQVLATSRDGALLAAGPSLVFSSLSDDKAAVHNPSPASSSKAPAPAIIRLAIISDDSTVAVTVADDKSLCVYDVAPETLILRSTRKLLKKASSISFGPTGPAGGIVVTDKVGDCFLYPLDPLPDSGKERPSNFVVNSDPSLNPDATLLLGHVSILTAHALSQDGRHIITADRDEHIRVSRYPQSFVVERYLFGTDGFVSALCVPPKRPSVLLSAGGEPVLRIWDWQKGVQLATVGIFEAVLPHRKARAQMRPDKHAQKRQRGTPATTSGAGDGSSATSEPVKTSEEGDSTTTFYTPIEGWRLPAGQGVCVKKIAVVSVDDVEVVVFHSEGCSAIHSFVLPSDLATISPSDIHTISFADPVLDFAEVYGQPGHLLVSLDTAWCVKGNQLPQHPGKKITVDPSTISVDKMNASLAEMVIAKSGQASLKGNSPLLPELYPALGRSVTTTADDVANLDLYADLSLMPRWPGMEEDDEMAGSAETDTQGESSAMASDAGESYLPPGRAPKDWTREELEKLNVKQLGRLKSQGVDIGNLITTKRKKLKDLGSRVDQLKGRLI